MGPEGRWLGDLGGWPEGRFEGRGLGVRCGRPVGRGDPEGRGPLEGRGRP